MDGKGRWIDNVFIERLWRSLKQECVYLNAFDSMRDATDQIGQVDRLLQPGTSSFELRWADPL